MGGYNFHKLCFYHLAVIIAKFEKLVFVLVAVCDIKKPYIQKSAGHSHFTYVDNGGFVFKFRHDSRDLFDNILFEVRVLCLPAQCPYDYLNRQSCFYHCTDGELGIMLKFSVYKLERVVRILCSTYGKGGDTADYKIVLAIFANIIHILMSAITGFFVCKREYGV